MRKAMYRFAEMSQQANNVKKFYKEATFAANPKKAYQLHNYSILLDSRTVKTPYRHSLAVPSRGLAMLVAFEFNKQVKYLKTGQMPILALCRTAVDADIEGHLREHFVHSVLEYLKTDTLLFVHERYAKQYQIQSSPLVEDFRQYFDMRIEPSSSIEPPIVEINEKFNTWLNGLNNWELIGLETMTIWMKSTIAAWSIINGTHDPTAVQRAAYLEQITQMELNGEVDEKLMDINQIKLMVSCGEMIYRLSSS